MKKTAGRRNRAFVTAYSTARKSLRAGIVGMVEDVGVPSSKDLAVGHEHHPVGHLAGEAHLVGDDRHGHAVLGQVTHQISTSPTISGSRAEVGVKRA